MYRRFNRIAIEFGSDSSIKDYGKPFETPFKGEIYVLAVQSFLDIESLGINTVFLEKINPTSIMVQLVDVDPETRDLRRIQNRLVPLDGIRNVVTVHLCS